MTGSFLRYLRMHTGEQQLRRVAVAKVMETNAREVSQSSEEPREFVRQALQL